MIVRTPLGRFGDDSSTFTYNPTDAQTAALLNMPSLSTGLSLTPIGSTVTSMSLGGSSGMSTTTIALIAAGGLLVVGLGAYLLHRRKT